MVAIWLPGFMLFLAVRNVEMHAFHTGACPIIQPQAKFDMKKMLGIWYVIEKTKTAMSTCMMYNITVGDKPDQYKLDQMSQNFLIGLTPIEHVSHDVGTLTVPDSNIPGSMIVRFPFSVGGNATFTVFMTDYDTYAGVWSCQKLAIVHRQSAAILSRKNTLDSMYLEQIRSKLSDSKVSPFELSSIYHKDCPKELSGINTSGDKKTDGKELGKED